MSEFFHARVPSPNHPSAQRRTYDVIEAAAVLGVSRTHAYRLVKSGEIPSVRLGRRVVVPAQALRQLLRDGVGGAR